MPKAKEAAKTAAKTAASTGTLTKDLRQGLKDSNVSQNVINKITASNKQAVASNKQTADRTANIAAVGNFAAGIDERGQAGQKIGQQYYDSLAATGAPMPSSRDIAQYAMDRGYNLGDKFQKEFGTVSQTRDASYKGVIDSAIGTSGATWNKGSKKVTGRDVKRLMKLDGYSPNQIMKIVAGTANLEGSSVGAAADKMLKAGLPGATKGKKSLSDIFFSNTTDPVMQGLGRSTGSIRDKQYTWGGVDGNGKPNQLTRTVYGDNPFGKGKEQTYTPGQRKGLTAEALTKKQGGTFTTPYTPTVKLAETITNNGAGGAGGAGGTETDTTVPTETDKQDININMPGVGSDIFSMATGWRSKKSRRAGGGPQSQGLASQRISPTGGWQYNIG
jgi:hypothetical protein